MAEYRLLSPDPNGPVLRAADGASIPADPANRDWVEYQDWCAAGNVPDPYVPPPEPEPYVDPGVRANERLDAGIMAAASSVERLHALPRVEPTDPVTQEQFAALQAQVDTLQAAVEQMLVAQAELPAAKPS